MSIMRIHSVPMARLFGLFVVLALGILGGALGLLAANGLDRAIERHLERLLEERSAYATSILLRYANNHCQMLEDLAHSPQLIQAVMQPQSALPQAIDLLERFRIVGKRHRAMLFNGAGMLLYDTEHTETCLPEPDALAMLLDGRKTHSMSFQAACTECLGNKSQYLRIMVPILWRAAPTGVLAVDISVNHVDVLREINQRSSLISMSIYKDWQVIFSPAIKTRGLTTTYELPELGVTLLFTIDLSVLEKERLALISNLSAVIVLVTVLFGSMACFVGHKLFVKPLMGLQRSALLVRQDIMPPEDSNNSPILEIKALDDALHEMAATVLQKRKELELQIAQRERVAEALRESEAFNKHIVENSPDCIKVLDATGRLRFVSPGGLKFMGVASLAPLLNKKYADFFPLDEQAKARKALEDARDGNAATFQAVMPDPRGTPHWWSESVTPLHIEGGARRILVVSRDITEIKRVEEEQRKAKEEAIAANRAKSEFLANMSHEIRTPMNGILGTVQLMTVGDLTDEQREYVQTIETSANALLTLIDDILDLSKIEAYKMELYPEPFRIRQLVRELCGIFASQVAAKGLEMSCEVAPDVPEILVGDVKRLRQICTNLVGNAVKFTEKGSVSMDVCCDTFCAMPGAQSDAPQTQAVAFTVRDTGVGIPEKTVEHIFEAFFQADGTASRRYGGTGLGLAISNRLVQLMGGTLEVRSAPARGSVFAFTLTFEVRPEALLLKAGEPAPALPEAPLGLNVLVVDDNEINRTVAKRMLEKIGGTVLLAGGANEALRMLRGHPCDVVLMDVQMPGIDGLEAMRMIRASKDAAGAREPYIVAMTAHAHERRQRAFPRGRNG